MPTGDEAPSNPACLTARRKAWVEPAGGVVQPAQQPCDGRQRSVGLAPVRIGRHGYLAVDEHKALASVLVDADWQRGTLESRVPDRP